MNNRHASHAQIPIHREPPVGPLRNGNPRGNPNAAQRCGAKTRAGCPCKAPAMRNGRCRMHGGASTGPSAEGRARIAAARTIHGLRAAPMRALTRSLAATRRRGSILAALVRARLKVEDLAEPIRQCRALPPHPPRTPPTLTRERCFVLRELTAMTLDARQTRSLVQAIAPAAKKPLHRDASAGSPKVEPHGGVNPAIEKNDFQPVAPKPPKPSRQPLLCRPARHPLPCRRLDPANPFPPRINPHATWNRPPKTTRAPRLPPRPAHC